MTLCCPTLRKTITLPIWIHTRRIRRPEGDREFCALAVITPPTPLVVIAARLLILITRLWVRASDLPIASMIKRCCAADMGLCTRGAARSEDERTPAPARVLRELTPMPRSPLRIHTIRLFTGKTAFRLTPEVQSMTKPIRVDSPWGEERVAP